MCICERSYPRKLAFSYLDELSKEFSRSYGDKVETVTRPYAFMGFGECGEVRWHCQPVPPAPMHLGLDGTPGFSLKLATSS
jgi:hypothetical protein